MSDDDSKLKITCGACNQVFSTAKPKLEISNNTFCSVVTGPHPDLLRCQNNKCRQAYVLMLGINEQGVLIWGMQPVDEKFVTQFWGSPIVKPSLALI